MAITISPRSKLRKQESTRVTVNNTGGTFAAVLSTDGLIRMAGTNAGLRFIGHAANAAIVTVDISFDHPELVLKNKAGAQAAVTWIPLGTVAAGAILADPDNLAPTAIRLSFTALGSVTISCN